MMHNKKFLYPVILFLIGGFFIIKKFSLKKPYVFQEKIIKKPVTLLSPQKPDSFQSQDSFVSKTQETDTVTGEILYKQNCAACHGMNRKGNPPSIPSLSGIGKRMNKQEILSILQKGRNGMPSFSHLPLSQRKAIVDFLLGKNTPIKIEPLTEVQRGKQIFISHCSMCHQAIPSDPVPTGRKNYGPVPAILGGIDKVMPFKRFEHILNRGPAYMPSFQEMSLEDKKAVYHYLSTLPYTRRSTRRCGGGRCGMSKCGR